MSSNKTFKFNSASEQATFEFGRRIGQFVCGGLTIAMYGGLGAGKTKLTQGIGSALGAGKIKSPTFILVSEHDTEPPLVHADLYRLESVREVNGLDLEAYTDDGCLLVVEWAERWENMPESELLKITFEETAENCRALMLEAFGEKAEKIIAGLANGGEQE